MKQKLYLCLMLLSVFLISNCEGAINVQLPSASATALMESPPSIETKTSTSTPLPTITFTPSPVPIALPAVTMSPQEAEDVLLELLKTNGNCTGKCLAGIRPDEMNVQEAIDQMAHWGMLSMSEDKDGRTFINNLYLDPNSKQVNLNLAIILRNKFETSYAVSFHIPRFEDDAFLRADIWRANREAWRAFQFDNLLKVYGTPSFVGFRFATEDLEGKSITYTLDVQYEQMNLEMGIGGLTHRDGQDVFICPSNDPHNLGLDINYEPPLKDRQQAYPITWQALTGSDLQAFYQVFTDENGTDGCVTTTLKKIRELDPYFQ